MYNIKYTLEWLCQSIRFLGQIRYEIWFSNDLWMTYFSESEYRVGKIGDIMKSLEGVENLVIYPWGLGIK